MGTYDDAGRYSWECAGRPGRKRGRKGWAARRAEPELSPEAQAGLAWLAGEFAAADPTQRRVLTDLVRTGFSPAQQTLLVKTLLQALLGGRAAAARAGLAAALADLGPVAAELAGYAVLRVKEGWRLAVLAGVLERAGLELPLYDRVLLLGKLAARLVGTTDADTGAAVARAVAALRHSLDVGPADGPSTPPP